MNESTKLYSSVSSKTEVHITGKTQKSGRGNAGRWLAD
jgi:hypothetical protein